MPPEGSPDSGPGILLALLAAAVTIIIVVVGPLREAMWHSTVGLIAFIVITLAWVVPLAFMAVEVCTELPDMMGRRGGPPQIAPRRTCPGDEHEPWCGSAASGYAVNSSGLVVANSGDPLFCKT